MDDSTENPGTSDAIPAPPPIAPTPPPPFNPSAPAGLPPAPGSWGAAPATPISTPQRRRLWPLITAVAAVGVGIALILALTGGKGSGLPDTFAGADRIDSGPVADALSGFSDSFREAGMEIEFAIYGGETDPRFLIMTFSGDAIAGTDLSEQFRQGLAAGMGGQIDLTQAIEDSVDGVDYLCAPVTSAQFGGRTVGMCMFQDGDSIALVMSLQDDQLHGLLEQTKELQGQLA